MSKQLSKDFLHELYKICLKNPEILLLTQEYLKFHFLPGEQYKLIWQSIINHYDLQKECISLGVLSQKFNSDEKVQVILSKIKKAELISQDIAVSQLKEFIRLNLFVDSYDKIGELYQKGEKDQAIELLKEAYEELDKFSLVKAAGYTEVFNSLTERLEKRREESLEKEDTKHQNKLPLGIPPIDVQIGGGVDRGDTICFMGESGRGKSKLLKWIGISMSRVGFKVLHIQLEGSEQEALDTYDAGITGSTISNIESGVFSKDSMKKIKEGVDYINNLGGEIYVKSYSQFNSATMLEIRSLVAEIDGLDAIIIDYLELAEPGNGKRYDTSNEGERARRTAISNEFKNICVESNIAGITATQSTTIDDKERNDPEFVLTRYHISEFKGLIKPFSYFFTMNQTDDEWSEGIIRLYGDKTRKYRLIKRVVPVYTSLNIERFYNHQKSTKAFNYG